ncbi:DUF1292 domain-containing protein [Garciella nitratireducens]|uniref:DUF1292 domain-containing protein n=1 Tax=Garciella nitratireducens TaxID=218205 RepID=UPI000DEA3CCD|nr:DUF1292 domain-containing protein [Garciella nitratireducens]RBP45543.1 uncharacterized protein DUF1292 [Garciella nitratireducens]
MQNKENEDIIYLMDENGNEEGFEIIATLTVRNKDYVILFPLEGEDDAAYIFRIDRDDNEEDVLIPVEDDNEFKDVQEEYERLLQNEEE